MKNDEHLEFVRQRARRIDAAIDAMSAGASARRDLELLQSEIDNLRAVEVTPARVVAELNALLSERVSALKYWAELLERHVDAVASRPNDRGDADR